ncbi:MAG TPA: alpha/beta fold hydrolase [Myxococcota bacterium]
MPHASIDGFEMYYERHGARGEPLVLVHGYTGDVSDWQHQIAAFSTSHRVLVMDHRGHGRSGAPSDRDSYTVERMSDDVEALAAHVGFDRYHLVGHSLGGMVAQEIALRSAGRLLSLTLEDSMRDFAFARSGPVRQVFEARLRLAEEQGMAAIARLPAPPRPPHHPRERFAQEQERLSRMALDGFAGGWQALCRWQGSQQRAHAIRTPTLVVCGELDAPLLPGSRWLAETIPGARLEIVPEAGHSPQMERPELFNAALRRHLAGRAG